MTRIELVAALNALTPGTLDVIVQDAEGRHWVVSGVTKTKRFKVNGKFRLDGKADETIADVMLLVLSEGI